jgi:DNA-binding IclR family transcriptional regulator
VNTDTDPKRDGDSRGAPRVEAVRRALRIMSSFGPSRPEVGVTDLARELGLHKSTVHRLLATLQSEGFVHQVEGGRYALTWKVLQLSAAVAAHRGIHDAVLQVLEPLTAQTQETAHLAVLDVNRVLYVEKVESPHQLRMPSAVGRHVPLHSTALGKVLAAGLDLDTLRHSLGSGPLERFTDVTITDVDQFLRVLDSVRADGYAIDDEEIEPGLMCVAAPVRDPDGVTCAAISIAGPASRVGARLETNIAAVREASATLSALLGHDARELSALDPAGSTPRANKVPA